MLFAFAAPFISIPDKYKASVNVNQFQFTNNFTDYPDFSHTVLPAKGLSGLAIDLPMLLASLYVLIVLLLLFRFIVEIIRIIKKMYAYDKIKKDRFTIVVNKTIKSPFSFLNYIFVEKFPGVDSLIIEHEKVHARQLHTIDLFILQISSALLWINPFMYLLKKELVAQHEFLADNYVLSNTDNHEQYLKQVLIQLQNNFNNSLASKFNYSLTKKRLKQTGQSLLKLNFIISFIKAL